MEKELSTRIITEERILHFKNELHQSEKMGNTITKYMRDIRKFQNYLNGRVVTKELAVEYKEYLRSCGKYKISSINTFLVVLNRFCECMGWYDIFFARSIFILPTSRNRHSSSFSEGEKRFLE